MNENKDNVHSMGDRILAMIRERHPGYHPLLAIAEMAHQVDLDDKIKLECHKTIVRYVTPELKSVEIKADINETRRVVVSLFEEAEVPAPAPMMEVAEQPLLAEKPDPLWDSITIGEAVQEEIAA